jgi:hypothetical protein
MDVLKQSMVENDAGMPPSLPESFTALRWFFINAWKVEPQSDDRTPVLGAVASNAASPSDRPSARRSAARRKHQAMFKKWSQDRHDWSGMYGLNGVQLFFENLLSTSGFARSVLLLVPSVCFQT